MARQRPLLPQPLYNTASRKYGIPTATAIVQRCPPTFTPISICPLALKVTPLLHAARQTQRQSHRASGPSGRKSDNLRRTLVLEDAGARRNVVGNPHVAANDRAVANVDTAQNCRTGIHGNVIAQHGVAGNALG